MSGRPSDDAEVIPFPKHAENQGSQGVG
jgi:hypothetical protein